VTRVRLRRNRAEAPGLVVLEGLHQLTDWALRRGTVLAGLTVDRPSLEDVYLQLTERTIR